MCFLPDGTGNGACMAGSADGNIYIYDQLESSEELPDSVILRKINPSKHAKKKARQAKKTAAIAASASSGPGSVAQDAVNGTLSLDYCYGFRTEGRSHVLHCVRPSTPASTSTFVFPTAGVGVVQEVVVGESENSGGNGHQQNISCTQCFLGDPSANGKPSLVARDRHTDDILALAVCDADRSLIATGETGKKPKVIVWQLTKQNKRTGANPNPQSNAHTIKATLVGFHQRGIAVLAFGKVDKSLLCTIGMDDVQVRHDASFCICLYTVQYRALLLSCPNPHQHKQTQSHQSVALYNWPTETLICTARGGKAPIFAASFHPYDGTFVTCGETHIKFWSLGAQDPEDNLRSHKKKITCEPKNGKFGRALSPITLKSIGWLHPEGLGPDKLTRCVAGATDGSLVCWDHRSASVDAARTTSEAHSADGHPSAAVNAICSHSKGVVTGGDDGRVIMWSHQLVRLFEFHLRRAHIEVFDPVSPEVTSLSLHEGRRELLVATKGADAYLVDLDRALSQKIVASTRVQVSVVFTFCVVGFGCLLH